MKKLIVLGLAALAVAFGALQTGGSGTALAEAETFTDTFKVSNCFPTGPGEEVCFTNKGVVHQTEQPDGDIVFKVNGEFCYSAEYCEKRHFTEIIREGEYQVLHVVYQSELSTPFVTCTYSFNAIRANGEFRHDHYEVNCEPVA